MAKTHHAGKAKHGHAKRPKAHKHAHGVASARHPRTAGSRHASARRISTKKH